MCGIVGYISLNAGQKQSSPFAKSMVKQLKHRGPDDTGIQKGDGWLLGQTRLAIIDLSPAGHQPMSNEDGSIWITFNGEIYNFQKLRPALEKAGHRFRSGADTEVILHLYEEKGLGCLDELIGMFAFAIWDENRQRLFIARDRTGEKPLVYATVHNTFYFASEIPALLQIPNFKSTIDPKAVYSYLTHTYFQAPAPLTMFREIKKLEPANYLLVDHGTVTTHQYWVPETQPKYPDSEEKLIKHYRQLLQEVVQSQMIADVPLGTMLSGGVDSSSIVAIMNELGAKRIKTYSLGFSADDPELLRARIVSDLFKTDHKEIIVSSQDLTELPKLIGFFGEPINLMPMIYSYKLVEAMRPEVTVVLNGGGGDEVFGGYDYYRESRILDYILKADSKTLQSLTQYGRFLPGSIGLLAELLATHPTKRKGFLYRKHGYELQTQLFTEKFTEQLIHFDVGAPIDRYFNQLNNASFLERVMYTDLMVGNIPSTVTIGDISGMAKGLEIRSPFLDKRMIEFAYRLPLPMRVRSIADRKFNKYIMKKAMTGILPDKIIYGQKMGFGYNVRWSDWLRGEWQKPIHDLLFDGALEETGYFSMDYVRTIYREHLDRTKDNSALLLGLAILSLWWQKIVIDSQSARTAIG